MKNILQNEYLNLESKIRLKFVNLVKKVVMRMKNILCGLFTVICLLGFSGDYVLASDEYTDVPKNYWAKESINKLTSNGVIEGYIDKTFKPNEPVKVNEFVKMIILAGDYEIIPSGINVWPDFYIATALENKLVLENEYTNYNIPITRKDVVKIVSRFVDLSEVKASKKEFKDEKNNIVLQKLITLKIINGYEDKTFRGDNVVTRAEAITIIDRAIQNRRKINADKKIDITQRTDLSNYGSSNNSGKYKDTRYEIADESLIIYDKGKYANLWEYKVSKEIIDIKKVNKIIGKLVSEDSYLGVFYSPSKYLANQLIVAYGEDENKINLGGSSFELIYYEDSFYELARISMEEKFSNKCYMRIELKKMWRDYSDFLNGKYVDEYNKRKLSEVLNIEFGSNIGDKILNYVTKKYEMYMESDSKEINQSDVKVFGKYKVNFYQKEHEFPKFYISLNK